MVRKLTFCLVWALLLSGCAPLVLPEQAAAEQWVTLQAGSAIGQTFVAEYDGLAAVQILLASQSSGDALLTLHLRADPFSEVDLGTARMPLQDIRDGRYYRFDFPALAHSYRQYYYAFLEVEGEGSLLVGLGPADAYLDGAAYQNHTPLDAQTAFALVYHRGLVALGLANQVITWIGVLGVGFLLFALPGWVLLGLTWPGYGKLGWPEKLGLACGMSLAVYVLLMLFTHLIGLQLGALYAWLPLGLAVCLVAWGGLKQGRFQVVAETARRMDGQWAKQLRVASLMVGRLFYQLPEITLLVLLALIFATRFWAIRGLDAPMWGDSVHHTYMAQLILDKGGLFESWQPYAPYSSLSMHFGFSAAAALFSWFTGVNSVRAVLWTGQILNGLAVLVLYPLAVRLARGNRWAGVGAVLAAGLVSPMPAYYVNWGRYAQLAGQVILPVSLWMTWDILEVDLPAEQARGVGGLPWRKLWLSGAVLAGMVLYQYRMPFYYLWFILAWLVGWGLPRWRLDWRKWCQGIGRLALVALIAGGLFLPWGLRIFQGDLAELVVTSAEKPSLLEIVRTDYQTWRNLFTYVPEPLAILALAAWACCVMRRDWPAISFGLWTAGMASSYALVLLGVPGAQVVQSFAVLITLYIPVGLLVGWLLGWVAARIGLQQQVRDAVLSAIVVVIGLWAAWGQRSLAQPEIFSMVTRPDSRAMAWIGDQIAPEARFLVEGFRAYWNTTAVGADAGWWIPLLAGKQNTMPPQYALVSEAPQVPGYSRRVVELVARLEVERLNFESNLDVLCEEGVTHVYIGQRQGMVGNPGAMLFSPQELKANPGLRLVYHQDQVYIFSLLEGVCGK